MTAAIKNAFQKPMDTSLIKKMFLNTSMQIQNYAQSTFETCLAVDLLQLTGKKISKKEELNTINYALNFSKDNFTIGHLDFIAKNYNLGLDFYVDNKWFLDFINKFKFSSKINAIHQKMR